MTTRIRRYSYDTTAVAGGNISYNYPEIVQYLRELDDKMEKARLRALALKYLADRDKDAEALIYKIMREKGFVIQGTSGHGLNRICVEIKELCV